MKTYSVPLGRRADYPHPAPERTASRMCARLGDDDVYQVWPSRKAMARSVRMQQQRAPHPSDWRPMVKLSDGEGY